MKPVPFDAHLCEARNLVERFFNKLQHVRAVATRNDKRNDSSLAAQRASIRIWLRACELVT